MLGVSEEVMLHHAAEHARAIGCSREAPVREVRCPCDSCIVLACGECGDAVFLAVRPGTWCEHATAVLGRFG